MGKIYHTFLPGVEFSKQMNKLWDYLQLFENEFVV